MCAPVSGLSDGLLYSCYLHTSVWHKWMQCLHQLCDDSSGRHAVSTNHKPLSTQSFTSHGFSLSLPVTVSLRLIQPPLLFVVRSFIRYEAQPLRVSLCSADPSRVRATHLYFTLGKNVFDFGKSAWIIKWFEARSCFSVIYPPVCL